MSKDHWGRFVVGPLMAGVFSFGVLFSTRGGGDIVFALGGTVVGTTLLSLTRILVERGRVDHQSNEDEMTPSENRSRFSPGTSAVFYFMFTISLGVMAVFGIVKGQTAFGLTYAGLSIAALAIGLWLFAKTRKGTAGR